jgi:hypothetical protein
MLLDRFVPPDELKRVTEGSYERLIEQLAEEATKASQRIFGQACQVKLVSTFPNHAVVLAESGDAARVRFEMSGGGEPMIVSHEPYTFTSVKPSDSKAFVESRSKEIVNALLEGDDNRAYSRAREILPMVEDKREIISPTDLVKLVQDHFGRECAWKSAYESNQGGIHKAIGSDLGLIDQNRTEAKFTKLYDGSIPVEQRAGYESLVHSDLIRVVESFERLQGRVEALTEKFTTLAASTVEKERSLGGFALDFEEDVQRAAKVLREAASGVFDVAARGQLHDVASKAMYRYDVAVRYIETATQDQG